MNRTTCIGCRAVVLSDAAEPRCRACLVATSRPRPVAVLAGSGPGREKNPHAAALGRLGGKKGGKARAAKLTSEQRSESARRAAEARWYADGPDPESTPGETDYETATLAMIGILLERRKKLEQRLILAQRAIDLADRKIAAFRVTLDVYREHHGLPDPDTEQPC